MESYHLQEIDYLKRSSKNFKNATGNCDFAGSKATYDCNLLPNNSLVRNLKYKMKIYTKNKESDSYDQNQKTEGK